jgi:hypothetical protein
LDNERVIFHYDLKTDLGNYAPAALAQQSPVRAGTLLDAGATERT